VEQILSAALFVLLYGVSYGLVLFIIAIGLVITMGLMQIVNLAHGAFAAIGGYIAVSLMNAAGMPYLATLCAAVVMVVLLSFVLERLIYVRLYGASHLDQILMTLGVNFIVIGAITILFGPNVYPVKLPGFLQGSVDLGLRRFEVYRIFVICLGLAVVVCLWALFERTSFGAKLRAAVDNGDEKRADVWDIREVFPLVHKGGRRPNGGTVLHNVYATSDDNHQFAILYSCHVTFVCSWLEIFVTSATSCYGQPAVPHGS